MRPLSPGLTTASTHLLATALWPVLCPTTVLTVNPPSAQSPFAQCECDPHWGDALSVSTEDITPPFAPTDSFASHSGLSPTSVYGLVGGVFAGCHPVPAARRTFPTLSPRIFPWMLDPIPRRSHSVHLPVSSAVSSAFPTRSWVGFPRNSPLETTSCGPQISGRQIFLYVPASSLCRPPGRPYRCAYCRRAAGALTSGQNVLRHLRTHRIC